MPDMLERELIENGQNITYCISSSYVDAANRNVSIAIPEGAADCGFCFYGQTYPRCPDCGGRISFTDGICAPGGRQCRPCGSRFADMREHEQEPGLHMPAMMEVRTDVD
ncbi:MAG: hypothetical protein J4F28_02090 [Nitrosopumilaceae archaeon]|nr:hypothetical protein [Nitrosopumilaceae archaeon]